MVLTLFYFNGRMGTGYRCFSGNLIYEWSRSWLGRGKGKGGARKYGKETFWTSQDTFWFILMSMTSYDFSVFTGSQCHALVIPLEQPAAPASWDRKGQDKAGAHYRFPGLSKGKLPSPPTPLTCKCERAVVDDEVGEQFELNDSCNLVGYMSSCLFSCFFLNIYFFSNKLGLNS